MVASAFRGIQIGVVFLILSAGLKMLKQMEKNAFNVITVVITIVSMVMFSLFAIKFSTIFYILISGTLGVILYLIGVNRKEGGK